ncbi:MAG: cytochrome P450 [Campylobacterales bacterium]|nr:cytochrome P450 [Campylobacterales bacterium]
MTLSLNDPAFFHDPYPYYAKLRESGQPYWVPHSQESTSSGVWLFSRYEDAIAIFKETSKISKEIRFYRPEGATTTFDFHLLHRDGLDHMRLRSLIADFFSIEYIDQVKDVISLAAEELIDSLKKKNEVDLMRDYAEALPLIVIAELMGVPKEDMPQIRQWGLAIGKAFDSLLITEDILQKQKTALGELLGYVQRIVKDQKEISDEKLLGLLINAHKNGEITYEELISMVAFLLFAGHETTINLIGNGLWLLLSHPKQWQLLRDDMSLLPQAVEEVLRYESPEQRTSFRMVLEPIEINGTKMNPGDQVGVIIGSANHDEKEFQNAEVFDIQRKPNRHLAFGIGIHNCLGKTLARVEAQIAFQKILEHLPDLELQETMPGWRKNSFFRGLKELKVQF